MRLAQISHHAWKKKKIPSWKSNIIGVTLTTNALGNTVGW